MMVMGARRISGSGVGVSEAVGVIVIVAVWLGVELGGTGVLVLLGEAVALGDRVGVACGGARVQAVRRKHRRKKNIVREHCLFNVLPPFIH
jgi:hypothetical protein